MVQELPFAIFLWRRSMNAKKVSVGIAMIIGLTLVLLLVVVAGATADSPQAGVTVLAEPDVAVAASTAGTPTFWSSGWTPISQDQILTFNHNLGRPPEQLAVELWFRDTDAGGMGINRANYGGLESAGNWYGAYWHHLTANTIQVHRLPDDINADQVRVQIWVASAPDYDSGWRSVTAGTTYFYHGLTVTPTDLSVAVWFSGTLYGINHFAYGGLTDGTFERGAYWWVTSNAVAVYRRPDDTDIEQVRVVVVHGAPPDYDSLVALGGWQDVAPGTVFTFTHNLHWNPDMLLVQVECRYTAVGNAVFHQHWAGGDEWAGGIFRGAYPQRLTANTVQFVRWDGDADCDQARVVIYKRSMDVYLPLVLRDY
jgi:hypothetical protein